MIECRYCGEMMPDNPDLYEICSRCAKTMDADGDWEAWGRSRCLLFGGPMWHKRAPANEAAESTRGRAAEER